jgi:hypothetical protein
LVAWTRAASGFAPSGHALREQKVYTVVRVPLGVILKIVPQPGARKEEQVLPPPAVVPYKSPLVAWTSAADGRAPSVPSKLNNVVNVCADRAIAVVAHTATTAYARFLQLSLPKNA